jgi:hypothetical protein
MDIFDIAFRNVVNVMRGVKDASSSVGSMIYRGVKKARTEKEIRVIYATASKANLQNRSVYVLPSANKQQLLLTSGEPSDNDIYDYQTKSSTPAFDFIWGESNQLDGAVVSGG